MELIYTVDELSDKTKINKNEFPIFYFLVNNSKRLIFILNDGIVIPFQYHKMNFLKIGQFLFYPLKNNKRISPEAESIFLNDCIKFISNNKIVDRIIQPSTYVIFQAYPRHSIYCPFGTYLIDLTLSIDKLWENIHSKHKNVIKNAEKNNVQLKYGEHVLVDFYNIYKKTMERSSMYCENFKYFQDLYTNNSNNILCGVAYVGEIPVGGILLLYSNFAAYYEYGASEDNTIVNGAINYLQWNTIKLLKEKEVKTYDFVGARLSDVSGTKLDGIQRFKLRFGANLKKGYIWKMDVVKWKCRSYDFILKSYWKFKGLKWRGDIIDQELLKYNAN